MSDTPEQTARGMRKQIEALECDIASRKRSNARLHREVTRLKEVALTAHDDALEKAADAAQANCAACGGDGYGPTVVAAYPDANGDPVPEQSQCECCGRQVTAIRALKREA